MVLFPPLQRGPQAPYDRVRKGVFRSTRALLPLEKTQPLRQRKISPAGMRKHGMRKTTQYFAESIRVLCGKYSSALRRVRWRSPHTRSRLSVFSLFSQGHVGGGWPACAFMASCILFCINMRFDWLRVCAYFQLAYMLLCKFLNKNKEISAYYAARNA